MSAVLVLAGGPDAEREVSIVSASAVAGALREAGRVVHLELIDRPTDLRALPGDVIFPVLHGRWGEGGALQDVLERDDRPYVGCGPAAARLCMDKAATKLEAARLGVRTPPAALLNPDDPGTAIGAPAVIKPVFEGSSVGLYVCPDSESFKCAVRDACGQREQAFMIERLVEGRELTCGVIERDGKLAALPIVEIRPAEGVYDYEAKYDRDDTVYTVEPGGFDPEPIQSDALKLARAFGVRHLVRIDFMLDAAGRHWFLEANTMPGFTPHSLLPMAAAGIGLDMSALCAHLVDTAIRPAEQAGIQARAGGLPT